MPLYIADASTDKQELLLGGGAATGTKGHYRVAAFTTVMTVFMGYATLFSTQHQIKTHLSITDDTGTRSRYFNAAVACLYIANLICRFAHILLPLKTGTKAMVATLAMWVSMSSLIIGIWWRPWDETHHDARNTSLIWVVIAYAAGGIGIGTFETNFLAFIAPLGPITKKWASLGIPCGINAITIGGFLLLSAGLHPLYIPVITCAALFVGITMFLVRLPSIEIAGDAQGWKSSFTHEAWSTWKHTVKHGTAYIISMGAIAMLAPGILLYIFPAAHQLALFGKTANSALSASRCPYMLPDTTFFAVYNACAWAGSLIGRWGVYARRARHRPAWGLIAVVAAVILNFTMTPSYPVTGWVAATLLFVGNGTVYNELLRYVDETVPEEHNVVATSAWLGLGDVGSVATSSILIYIKVAWVGTGMAHSVCAANQQQ
jgi:hypothetical protein